MKVKLELELPEADIIFKALKVIDPHTIFIGQLLNKITEGAKPAIEQEKETK